MKTDYRYLIIGPDKNDKGGISSVINYLSPFYTNFIDIVTTSSGNKLKKILIFFTAIYNLIYQCAFKSIDLVHIHSASNIDFYRSSLFLKIAKLFNKKTVLHLHGGKFEEFYNTNPIKINKICNKSDAIITVSNYFKNFALQKKINKNIYLLPNGIFNIPKPFNRSNHPYPLNFLFMGSIYEFKGIFDIIRVVGKNKNFFNQKIKLKIAGLGETDRLKKIISQYGIENLIDYVGWLNKEEKEKYLKEADIYIQPSHFESFGISILEAMSYGLPIISSNIGGIPDFAQDKVNALLIEPKNEPQLFEAMKWVIENYEETLKLGHNAQSTASNYTPDKIKIQLSTIYQEILNN